MILTRLYYQWKPLIPLAIRWKLRRARARRIRKGLHNQWPILEAAGQRPPGWSGWKDGKRFALVLTHDVESQTGVDRVRKLAELEMEAGLRSSFNFIPEGTYRVPSGLREWLIENGFEVGVHDFNHDGHLYSSREGFRAKAKGINRYLEEWKASGFRAGFMLRRLDWFHDLNILYDLSTFDTDPFEPQPDGFHTIFPYWIPSRNDEASEQAGGSVARGLDRPIGGYVEMPYTLPQDSTLFCMLEEKSPKIWKEKLDWIADRNGMALLNVHPDYMSFEEKKPGAFEYPAAFYDEFLRFVTSKYQGNFWNALPREVAERTLERLTDSKKTETNALHPRIREGKAKIWIDLDNTPHVPFFEPIIRELELRGYPVIITARDAFQVCALADRKRIPYRKIGRHHGKNRLAKGAGLLWRAGQVLPTILRERPQLAVSHGSRAQMIAGNLARIPSLLIDDYEFSDYPPGVRPTYLLLPEVVSGGEGVFAGSNGRVRHYPGLKEQVYLSATDSDPALLEELGIDSSKVIVTVRPPATEAHYHDGRSEDLFALFMDRACRTDEVRVVLLPRNRKQEEWIRSNWPEWFEEEKTVIPGDAIDGVNLILNSDLVVSAGGTMNREAASLGVPAYSIFQGPIGSVDRHLSEEGSLILLSSREDVGTKILLEKRPVAEKAPPESRQTLTAIVDAISELADEVVSEQKTPRLP